jgi:hypothetical protein
LSFITRTIEPVLNTLASRYPFVTIPGPRQNGKNTLCRQISPNKPYANLESPDIREFAIYDPRGFLSQYPDRAILDEMQRSPDLVSYIQPMVDSDSREGAFYSDRQPAMRGSYFKGLNHFAKLFPDQMPKCIGNQKTQIYQNWAVSP